MFNNASLQKSPISHHQNQNFSKGPYPKCLENILSFSDMTTAYEEITEWPGYAPTALHSLNKLAQYLNVAKIDYKDESSRFGLGSFKALGGAYGVLCFLREYLSAKLGTSVSPADIRAGKYEGLISQITIVTATDGNHGRSVAWGAKLFGCECRIYVHSGVSQGRREAMAALGAIVIGVDGTYDQSVDAAAADANANSWYIISDTSYNGYTHIPKFVMAGYTVMMAEISALKGGETDYTHVFLQGGVGGLAAAVTAYLGLAKQDKQPTICIVEPDLAPCLIESARAGQPTTVDILEETVMAGLSCGKVSLLAWEILSARAAHFMTISDTEVPDAMRALAAGKWGENSIEAGESAVAGLIALNAVQQSAELARKLGINNRSKILVIGTEGATDADIYKRIIASE